MVARERLLAGVLLKTPRPIPSFGSPEWEKLPAGDIRIFAAVLVAAECWFQSGTVEAITERLTKELDERACPWCPDKVDVPGSDVQADVRGHARIHGGVTASGTPHAEMDRRRKEKPPG